MKKSVKVLHYFGLDCEMLEFFKYSSHEPSFNKQLLTLPHFWSLVWRKRLWFVPIQPVCRRNRRMQKGGLTSRVFPPLLVSAPSSHPIRDSNSCFPDLELGALTKWLASRMLVWVSQHASLQCSLQCRFGTAHGLGLVEKYCLPCLSGNWVYQASESVIDMPSFELTWSCDRASPMLRYHVGSFLQKDLIQGSFL